MLALNAIPVMVWVVASLIYLCVAVPVFFLWNWLAPIYAYWLPPVYLNIPFWDVFGLIWLITSLKQLVLPNVRLSNEVEK